MTLQKASDDDYIGLTVSYSSGNGSTGGAVFSSSEDTDGAGTEVYISCILPDSVAGRDGRLRQGDQILQVNGRDVSTRDETEQLFAQDRNAVTLLVSRCLLYGEDGEGEDVDEVDDQLVGYEPGEVDDDEDELLLATYQNCQPAIGPDAIKPNSLRLLPQSWPIDPGLDHTSIKAHLDSVNMEISALDTRIENLLLHKSSSTSRTVAPPAAATDEASSLYRSPIDATTNGGHRSKHTNSSSSGRGHQHSLPTTGVPSRVSLSQPRNPPPSTMFHSSE